MDFGNFGLKACSGGWGFWEKKLKVGEVLDFTAEFELKVSQVTAGFGYGEGY